MHMHLSFTQADIPVWVKSLQTAFAIWSQRLLSASRNSVPFECNIVKVQSKGAVVQLLKYVTDLRSNILKSGLGTETMF